MITVPVSLGDDMRRCDIYCAYVDDLKVLKKMGAQTSKLDVSEFNTRQQILLGNGMLLENPEWFRPTDSRESTAITFVTNVMREHMRPGRSRRDGFSYVKVLEIIHILQQDYGVIMKEDTFEMQMYLKMKARAPIQPDWKDMSQSEKRMMVQGKIDEQK